MTEIKKELIHNAVGEAFKYYESRGYDGHKTQPQIIEESNQFAEKLAEANLSRSRGLGIVASIATYLACESRGCPINLRMAKDSSEKRIKTADLQKAREITGVEPKMTAVDWVDGVVRTLRNANIISTENEEKVIEKTVLEISKAPKLQSPRYKAIDAVYQAMKKSGIDVTQEEIHYIFNISTSLLRKKQPKSHYDKISKDVNTFLRKNSGMFYRSKDLKEILGLDIKVGTLGQALSTRKEELDFQKFQAGYTLVYGFSDICADACRTEQGCSGRGLLFPIYCTAINKPTLKIYSPNQ